MMNVAQPQSNINSFTIVENFYRKIENGLAAWKTHRFLIEGSRDMGRQYLCALNNTLEPNCLYEVWARIVMPQTPGTIKWSPPLLAYRNHYRLSLKWANYL